MDDRELLVPVDLIEENGGDEEEGEGEGEKGDIGGKGEEKLHDVDLGHDQTNGCCGEGGCYHSNNHSPLSVQSGDIVRPPAPSLPPSHSRTYRKLYPYVLKAVSYVFWPEKYAVVPLIVLVVLSSVAIMLGCLVLLKVFPLTYNISISSVQVPDHESSIHWDAYQAAVEKQFYNETNPNTFSGDSSVSSKNLLSDYGDGGGGNEGKAASSSSSCCNSGSNQRRMHGTWVLELVYRGRGGRNLLETRHIEYLHSIEEHIYNLPKYSTVCHFAFRNPVCDPVNSLLTYLYPRSTDDGSLERDALPDDWRESIDTSQLTVGQAEQLLWYTGGNIGNTSLLRAQVRVGVPLPCYCSYGDRTNEQHQKVKEFFISLIPFLKDASTSEVEVLYGGGDIFDYELNQAKYHDLLLGIGSFAIVLVAMFVLTGFSVCLTFWGGVALIMCFLISLFVYRVVLGYETFSILTIVTIFVIIGIGVDDVFVFLNTFKQSRGLEGLDSTHKRLTHTILVATSATFCTSATTAIAFLANAVSQIPAVRQFAIFTGVVVIFCFITVAITMPLFLHVWQVWLLPVEDFIFKLLIFPFRHLINFFRHLVCRCSLFQGSASYSVVPPVRMTELTDMSLETDSGIIEDRGSDSTGSDSNSVGSDSHSSTSSLVAEEVGNVGMEPGSERNGTKTAADVVSGMEEPVNRNPEVTRSPTIENRITVLVQKALLITIARAVMLPQLVRCRCLPDGLPRTIVRWTTRLLPVVLFIAILVSMGGATSQLEPSDGPPQIFDPNSNIQKLLNLQGNLTDVESVNCWNCSAWYIGTTSGGGTAGGGTQGPTSGTTQSSTTNPATPPPHTATTTATTATTATTSGTTSKPTDHTTPPPTSSTSSPSSSSPTSASSSPSDGTPPTNKPPPTSGPAQNPNLVNNVVVNVVFGVEGVKRKYSTSHVLPVEGEGRQAVLDKSFSTMFTCPPSSSSYSLPSLLGTLRAMCRVCHNISNPANGLVLNGTFTCFPPEIVKTLEDKCLPPGFSLSNLEECREVKGGNSYVRAHYNYTKTQTGAVTLRFLAMAFRSTTSPSDSATENIVDYDEWEDFLSSELNAIHRLSGPGQPYEGAWDIIQHTFQASGYWVDINTEIIAIRGSFYGILISIMLCGIVVAVLSHDWSIVLAMGLTILGILVTLLGLFKMLGWTLGIIEAISLSILVGNSLDYCIHLTEGYMATDQRHLAFLHKFKFTHGASPRVQRVMSAISFIGVSILSSAITTFLATIPLLATQIRLLTRFGQILILDTVVAILYTLFFCTTFLSLFGPVGTSRSLWRVLNAVLTITGTVVLMLIIFFVSTEVMSMYNII